MQTHVDWGGPNQEYRYTLWRYWDDTLPFVQFIGLNPSTADDKVDDPTIRTCIRFSRDWGYGGLCMTNLFAFRATQPSVMKTASYPIGEMNDAYLQSTAEHAKLIVAAWGTSGTHMSRDQEVLELLRGFPISCLCRTKDGHPHHPLRIPKTLVPESFA